MKSFLEASLEQKRLHPDWSDEQCRLAAEYHEAVDDLIPFAAKVMPKLGNKGAGEIVDIAGGQNALRKATDKLEKLLKEIIDEKSELKTTFGERYKLTYGDLNETTRLDQTVAKLNLEAIDVARANLALVFKSEVGEGIPMDPLAVAVDNFLKTIQPRRLANCMVTTEGGRRTFSRIGS